MASAYDFDEEMRCRLGTKTFRHLRKPIAPRELIDAVDQAAQVTRTKGSAG